MENEMADTIMTVGFWMFGLGAGLCCFGCGLMVVALAVGVLTGHTF